MMRLIMNGTVHAHFLSTIDMLVRRSPEFLLFYHFLARPSASERFWFKTPRGRCFISLLGVDSALEINNTANLSTTIARATLCYLRLLDGCENSQLFETRST